MARAGAAMSALRGPRLPALVGPALVVALALGLAAVFLRAMLAYNQGRPGAPVDDA